MHPHAQLIQTFYEAFAAKDPGRMAACYGKDVIFSDPVFTHLKGSDASLMWHMLCQRSADLRITFNDIYADDIDGRAHWEASYTFVKTARPVLNVIEATFKFKHGRICSHKDSFNFQTWAHQAFGPLGWLFGGRKFFKARIQNEAARSLAIFKEKNREQ